MYSVLAFNDSHSVGVNIIPRFVEDRKLSTLSKYDLIFTQTLLQRLRIVTYFCPPRCISLLRLSYLVFEFLLTAFAAAFVGALTCLQGAPISLVSVVDIMVSLSEHKRDDFRFLVAHSSFISSLRQVLQKFCFSQS